MNLRPLTFLLLVFTCGLAPAQDGGLLHQPVPQGSAVGLTLENASFTYQALPPDAESRELRKEDIITVLVDYRSSMLSEGQAESRKTSSTNAVLSEWLGSGDDRKAGWWL